MKNPRIEKLGCGSNIFKYQSARKTVVYKLDRPNHNRPEDTFFGSVTTQDTEIGKKIILGNKLCCYVIHSFSTKFTIPAAHFFHKKMSTEEFTKGTQCIKIIT